MHMKIGGDHKHNNDPHSASVVASPATNVFADQSLHAGLLRNYRTFHRKNDDILYVPNFLEDLVAREMQTRIREDILIEDILRRRKLEEEVINGMMIEKEILLKGGIGCELASFGQPQSGNHGGIPFQRGSQTTNIAAVEPIIDLRKAKVVPLAVCTSSTIHEKKRKLETSKTEEGEGNPFKSSKKCQKELKCALCQITATSEQALEDHLKGRKHKAKEKAFLSTSRTPSINSEAPKERTEASKETVLMSAGNLRQDDEELKNKNDARFWCKMCSFGTDKGEQMANHLKGENHMNLLKVNGGCVIVIDTTPDQIQCVNNKTEDTAAEEKEE